jgi:hypothetical protein
MRQRRDPPPLPLHALKKPQGGHRFHREVESVPTNWARDVTPATTLITTGGDVHFPPLSAISQRSEFDATGRRSARPADGTTRDEHLDFAICRRADKIRFM